MSSTEVMEMMIYLQKFYKRGIDKPIETAEAWADILKDYTKDEIMLSVKAHVRRSPYFPTVSEIIEGIVPAVYASLGMEPVKLSEEVLGKMTKDQRKVEELKQKYTRQFREPEKVIITKDDVEVLNELIDVDVQEGDEI